LGNVTDDGENATKDVIKVDDAGGERTKVMENEDTWDRGTSRPIEDDTAEWSVADDKDEVEEVSTSLCNTKDVTKGITTATEGNIEDNEGAGEGAWDINDDGTEAGETREAQVAGEWGGAAGPGETGPGS
jgi:hypothetical protein